jgi:HEAT repeat protein
MFSNSEAPKHFGRQLRRESARAAESIRKELAAHNSVSAAECARVAAELGLHSLTGDLVDAFGWFFAYPARVDPQCTARTALARALTELGYLESAPFLLGLRHVQMEPAGARPVDTASALRARCALGLAACTDLSEEDIIAQLNAALGDPDKTVRAEAARAIGRIGSTSAALVLRLRASLRGEEPEVLGACFSALLSIDSPSGIEFVSPFLRRRDRSAQEAASALARMRNYTAFRVLRNAFEDTSDASFEAFLLSAIALTYHPRALEFVVRLANSESSRSQTAAFEALVSACRVEEEYAQVAAAVDRVGHPQLQSEFSAYFKARKAPRAPARTRRPRPSQWPRDESAPPELFKAAGRDLSGV